MTAAFTPRAAADLAHIRAYIAQDSPLAASRIAVELVAACDRLEQFPNRGRQGPRRGTRELTTVWPYIILYRMTAAGGVEVLRIWHGRQSRTR